MSENNQPRNPKGVPTGGQWRATRRPEGPSLANEPEDRDRTRVLTADERDRVREWRAVASRYRHGDCKREGHKLRGCDIVCVAAHSRFQGDEGASQGLRRLPWEKSYRRRTTDEDNAVTDLMCRLVMHAVPKPVPCNGKQGHPASDCRACAVESERQMLFAMGGRA